MKSIIRNLIPLAIASGGIALGQNGGTYTNFIRQVQMPTGVQWDASVTANGQRNSALPIDLGGARFELWTVLSSPPTSYLLDTKYVSAYLPAAEVAIRSEDPYTTIPRTRADRPFFVDLKVDGILSGDGVPEASKAVKLLRHVQSYGVAGVGQNLDRSQATLLNQAMLTQNGTQTLTYALTSVTGADRAKIRGEERFSVYSLADGSTPESQVSSRYVQIWPVADGAISGIKPNEKIRAKMPDLTLALNDLYPDSKTYAQVYEGAARLGVTGKMVPGATVIINDSIPNSRVLSLRDYDSVFDKEGLWTLELLTETPFGIDRLAHVTFTIDRTLKIHATFTTIE